MLRIDVFMHFANSISCWDATGSMNVSYRNSYALRAIIICISLFQVGCFEKPVPRSIAHARFLNEGVLNHFDEMERILKLYPDLITERQAGDQTLLHAAAMEPHPATVEFLLKHNAEINVVNKFGETPLYLAVQGKHLENVVILLKAGADFTICDGDNGLSPLDVAARRGLPEIIKVLVEHGANVDQGNSPKNGFSKLIETPLIRAVNWNEADAVDELLACKATVDLCDSGGYTPLMIAIDRDQSMKSPLETPTDIRIVKSLLAAGADPELASKDGETAKLLAKKYKDKLPEIAKLLSVE